MLIKLYKYDMKAGFGRILLIVEISLLMLLANFITSLFGSEVLNTVVFGLTAIFAFGSFAGYIVLAVQFMHNSLSGSVSYFNYTLPVGLPSMLFSKLLSVWTWGIIAVASAMGLFFASAEMLGMNILPSVDPYVFGSLLLTIVLQYMAMSVVFLFTVVLSNTGGIKRTNIGPLIQCVITYFVMQAVGVLEVLVLLPKFGAEIFNDGNIPDGLLYAVAAVVAVFSVAVGIGGFIASVKLSLERRQI